LEQSFIESKAQLEATEQAKVALEQTTEAQRTKLEATEQAKAALEQIKKDHQQEIQDLYKKLEVTNDVIKQNESNSIVLQATEQAKATLEKHNKSYVNTIENQLIELNEQRTKLDATLEAKIILEQKTAEHRTYQNEAEIKKSSLILSLSNLENKCNDYSERLKNTEQS